MWSSANGSGIRIQRMPGATSTASPGGGGAANGKWSGADIGDGALRRSRRPESVTPVAVHLTGGGAPRAAWPPRRANRAPLPRAMSVEVRDGAVKPVLCCLAMKPRAKAATAAPTCSISELAKEFALTTRAIRFYEDCGLLSPRRFGSARVYGERERVRIKLILRGKRLGLSLAEIGELLDLYEVARNERAQLSKFLELLAERRGRLLQQKEDIDATLAEIEGLERECRRRLKEPEARGHGHAAGAAPTAD